MSNSSEHTTGESVESRSGTDSLKGKSVRGAAYMAGTGAVETMVRLAATIVLARLLSPDELGLVAMVLVFLGFIEYIKDLALGVVTVQKLEISHEHISSLFWVNVLLGLAFTLMLSVAAPLLTGFFGDPRLTGVTLCLAPSLLLGGAVVQLEALLLRRMQQGPLAAIRFTATVLSSGVAIVMAAAGMSYWALVARELVRAAAYLIGSFWYTGWRPAWVLQLTEVASDIRYGSSMSVAFVVTAMTSKVDSLLVGKFFGSTDLGLYRQAQGIVMAPIEQFNSPILNVAQPALAALQDDSGRYHRYFQQVVRFVAMVTMPIGVFLAIYSDEFTLTVLGPKWEAAAPFVQAFALTMILRPMLNMCVAVLVTLRRTKTLVILELAYSATVLVFVSVGVTFGAVHVAFALALATACFAPFRLIFSLRDTPVSTTSMLRAIRYPAFATLTMGSVLIALERNIHTSHAGSALSIGIAIGFLTYVAAWFATAGGREELASYASAIRGALRRSM